MSKDIICSEKPKRTRYLFGQSKTLNVTFTPLALRKLENIIAMRMVICGPEMVRQNPSDILAVKLLQAIRESRTEVVLTAVDLGNES